MSSSDTAFASLMQRARDGESAAGNRIFATCRNYLLFVANQELPAEGARKFAPSDLVQNVLLKAAKNIKDFRGQNQSALHAWLRQILRNEIVGVNRHLHAVKRDVGREGAPDSQPAWDCHQLAGRERRPDSHLVMNDDAHRLRIALGSLAEDYRTVVLLRNWERLAFKDVAIRMGRSENAVKKLWARALLQLESELNESPPNS